MNLPPFLTRNLKLKIGSTIFALVTWVGVVYAGNPPELRTVSVQVPQQKSQLPPKYVLVHSIPDLQLRIGGSRSSLDAFSTSMLSVTVNWKAVRAPGVQQVPISIANSDPSIELVDPPRAVTADIDSLDSESLAVNIKVTNPPPAGYFIASQAASPDTVIVTGPHLEVSSGLQAVVVVDLGNNKTNFVEDSPVLIYDARGEKVVDVGVSNPPGSASPSGEVKVTIIVSANITSRAAAVLPRTSGNVAPGHEYAGIVFSPQNVVLSGPQNLLNALDAVFTSPISLSGLTGNTTYTVNVQPPDGVTALPGTVTVTIFVKVLPPPPTPAPTPTPRPTPVPSSSP